MRHGSVVRVVALGLLAASLGVTAAGCGSDAPTAAAPSTTAPGAGGTVDYDKFVPDAEVTKGLATVRSKAAQVQEVLPTQGVQVAKKVAAEMQDAWYGFEATVRRNEKTLYLKLEDALADINAGARDDKLDRIVRGLQLYDEVSAAYLEKHP
jgi:hypothetical protein